MNTLTLRWSAKYGHFLRAEANVNALTYPVPPRTAILGMLAAILGLEKDALATELAEVQVAISGVVPTRFWHKVKLRKDPPTSLPWEIKRSQKASLYGSDEKAALHNQEWLFKPDFLIQVAWPQQPQHFTELVTRIQHRRWHFNPCMGLSELLCDVEFISTQQAQALPAKTYTIQGVCPANLVRLMAEDGLGVHLLRLPYSVSAERVFQHVPYYLEHRGQPFAVETQAAWKIGEWTGLFL